MTMPPSHAPMASTLFLESQAFVGEILMTWRPCSPDLNTIEYLTRGLYERGEQFTSKDILWNKIVDIARSLTSFQMKQLTS